MITNLTVFLLKETVIDFQSCIKNPEQLITVGVKEKFHMDAMIYYCDSNKNPPKWKQFLDEYTSEAIKISENTSNKAVMLVRIESRIMALVFGYGRSFLKEEYIEKNFGFKVALNTINPKKIRSINSATIEDMVVNTQRQTSYSTTQEEFDLSASSDILMGVTGKPYTDCYGTHISGKDSLIVAVDMEVEDLGEKLKLYYRAFSGTRYKDIGFEWVDNINEVRDPELTKTLDSKVEDSITNRNLQNMHIAPPETTNWDQIIGFCYTGIGLNEEDQKNYTVDLDLNDYVTKIRSGTNVNQKIRRDKLMGITNSGSSFTICSIYAALTYQICHENENYILYAGKWYRVNAPFFEHVSKYITTYVKKANITLPVCEKNMCEGEYNEMAVAQNQAFCLMDKKMVGVENGPKKIEACDIFTTSKQLIHVKNKGQSSQLSHLFSQGKVSAECFTSDEEFRRQVAEIAYQKFGSHIFDYKKKPESNEFEIIYAIIDKSGASVDDLPFFSKVNLMITAQELDKMHFNYSLCFVEKKV